MLSHNDILLFLAQMGIWVRRKTIGLFALGTYFVWIIAVM